MAVSLKETVTSLSKTVPEDLFDRAITHSTYLEYLKRGEVNSIIGFLQKDVFPDIVKKLEERMKAISARGYDLGPTTTARLQKAVAAVAETIRGGMNSAGAAMKKSLQGIALTEAEWQRAALNKSVGRYLNVDFSLPAVSSLKSIVDSVPMQGHVMDEWWGTLTKKTQDEVGKAIKIGVVEGESVSDIVKRLEGTAAFKYNDGVFGKTARSTEAVARTSVNHVVTQAREQTFNENADLIKGVQYVATLDDRTSMICASLDGKVFPVDEGPRPPQHYNCRSTVVPVLKSLSELGFKGKKVPSASRASMNGQVPEKQTYGSWLKKQPKELQDEVLGPTRAELFRTGEVKLDGFVNDQGKVMNLEELQKKEGIEIPKVLLTEGAQGTSDIKSMVKEEGLSSSVINSKIHETYKELLSLDKADNSYSKIKDVFINEKGSQIKQILQSRDKIISKLQSDVSNSLPITAIVDEGKKFNSKAKEATDFVSSLVSTKKKGVKEIAFYVNVGEEYKRPFFNSNNLTLYCTSSTKASEIVHEIGHALETTIPNLAKKAKQFLAIRVAGEKMEEINKFFKGTSLIFDRNERGWRDKFIDPYMGKYYPKSTELLSMGLEMLFANPQKFYQKDPEMFNWLVNLLGGVL